MMNYERGDARDPRPVRGEIFVATPDHDTPPPRPVGAKSL